MMVKVFGPALVTILLVASTAFGEVRLTIGDGRVTVIAQDATIRQILVEWARVGGTRVVNLERIPGGAVTIELTNVSEIRALDVLLRSVSGYVASVRSTSVANLSLFDRIVVLPTSTAPRAAEAETPSASSPIVPPVSPSQFILPQADDRADNAGAGPAVNRAPPAYSFPQSGAPGVIVQQQAIPAANAANAGMSMPAAGAAGQQASAASPAATQPTNVLTTSPGTPVPGLIVQPPQPPPPVDSSGARPPPGVRYVPYTLQVPPSSARPASPPTTQGSAR